MAVLIPFRLHMYFFLWSVQEKQRIFAQRLAVLGIVRGPIVLQRFVAHAKT